MKRMKSWKERGQSLVLMAVLMVVFVGMLVVVLDGGQAYFQRRSAQRAADAGALAGARELCLGNDYTTSYNRAEEYACTRNGADAPPDTLITVNEADKLVTVDASITFGNLFATFLGDPDTTARATATAGCFRPCFGESVLPIVWSCQPPIEGWDSSSEDCQQQRITFDQLQAYLAAPPAVHPELYIVMDSLTYDSDVMCIQDPDYDPSLFTGIDCDFDGDGESDFFASGGRSWVDLDGSNAAQNCPGASGEGSSELSYWITNGFGCELYRHSWIPQQTGVTTSVFDAAWNLWKSGNPLVLVPVFDDLCKDGNPASVCPGRVHAEDVIFPGSGSQSHFHIIDFALFNITCVRKGPSGSCPGQTRFSELNGPPPDGNDIYNNGELNSMRSIEGYFIEGIPPGLGGKCTGGVDTGIYTLFLDD